MTDERIIAYLLEELPEEELERFEEECFAQEDWPAQIHLVEEDLIDAYLQGELTPEQRRHFEQNYLTTEARQERVVIAAAILRQIEERCEAQQEGARQEAAQQEIVPPPSQRLTWAERLNAFWKGQTLVVRTAAALALLVIIAGSAWLYISRRPATYATFNLTISNSNRADGPQIRKISLPRDADELRLSLTLPERLPPAKGYQVDLESSSGEPKRLKIVGQDAQAVTIAVSTADLTRDQYALTLYTLNTDGARQRVPGNYFFEIE